LSPPPPRRPTRARWVATCARGLEEILRGELDAGGFDLASAQPLDPAARTEVGGIAFHGDLLAGVRANWRLRTANRVLLEVASWPAADDEALYRGLRDLLEGAWRAPPPTALGLLAEWLRPERSFAVAATSSRSAVRDTRWIALRAKDAVVDAQRDRFGRRADVERDEPDVALRLRLHADVATLLVDTSGEPLDRRGYRVAPAAAPLREQLAAAAILASGWDGRGPVVDPMCGSGTLLAEAGALAAGLAPNRLRPRFGFARLPGFEGLLEQARREPIPAPDPASPLVGVDLDPEAIAAARLDLRAAGLEARAILSIGDGFEIEPPPGPGLVAVNPPYGERLAADPALWGRLGDLLKRRFRGWRAVVVAGDPALGKRIGLRPARRIPVWNGPLEARLLVFELY
jgi:putative N6-adenine-specific DNA methylase